MSLKCHVFCILYVTSDEEYKDIECNAISLYDCQHYSMDHKAPIVRWGVSEEFLASLGETLGFLSKKLLPGMLTVVP